MMEDYFEGKGTHIVQIPSILQIADDANFKLMVNRHRD
jgi:hypothetical protein